MSSKLHIICGVCGCNTMFSFRIDPTGNCNYEGDEVPAVFISCGNCSTLTSLDEHMEEKDSSKEGQEGG